MADRADYTPLAYWYWLGSVKGIGPAAFRLLLDRFKTPEAVHEAPGQEIRDALSQSRRPATALADAIEREKSKLVQMGPFVERQQYLAAACGGRILTLDDPDYPPALRAARSFAPPVLHLRGDLKAFGDRRVSIVGTRDPSAPTRLRVIALGKAAVEAGYTIVSGLARGIDAMAHAAALDAHGTTVAVLGCGADFIYPPENRELFLRLADHGLILSEFPFGVAPSGDQLRKRNKLIVASADAVLVAEAPMRSGAMIAARAALQQRKPLLALSAGPGTDPGRSAGTTRLIAEGLAVAVPDDGIDAVARAVATYAPQPDAERRFVAVFVEPSGSARTSSQKTAGRSTRDVRRTVPRPTEHEASGSAGAPAATFGPAEGRASVEAAEALPEIASGGQLHLPADEAIAEADSLTISSTESAVPAYHVGERVRHGRYGEGKVVAVADKDRDQSLTIAFPRVGKKQFLASLVALERI